MKMRKRKHIVRGRKTLLWMEAEAYLKSRILSLDDVVDALPFLQKWLEDSAARSAQVFDWSNSKPSGYAS